MWYDRGMTIDTSTHPKACVCVACCDRRGGKRAADVKVGRAPRQLPDLRTAGNRITVTVWVMVPLFVLGLLIIASAR